MFVQRLITLATPHDGSPLASLDALADAPALLNYQNLIDSVRMLMEVKFSLSPMNPNLCGLQWDNYDGIFATHPEEWNHWLTQLNRQWKQTVAADPRLMRKIVAYGSTIKPRGNCSMIDQNPIDCGSQVLTHLGYRSDGIVPLSSALFENLLPFTQERYVNVWTGHSYDHVQLVGKKANGIHDPLFSMIAKDLSEVPAPISAASPAQRANLKSSASRGSESQTDP
jgi:hypothetical protein